MVKVLQLGGPPRVIQCPDCHAVLHYEISDIQWDSYGNNDYITCPFCYEAIFNIKESRSCIEIKEN